MERCERFMRSCSQPFCRNRDTICVRKAFLQLQLNQGGMMSGMMAAAYTIHDGEEIKINLNNRIVYEGEKTIYRVAEAWYGNEELHLEMMDLNDGHKEDLVLVRVKEDVPLAEGEFQCSCGYRGEVRRFCPNCGKEII